MEQRLGGNNYTGLTLAAVPIATPQLNLPYHLFVYRKEKVLKTTKAEDNSLRQKISWS